MILTRDPKKSFMTSTHFMKIENPTFQGDISLSYMNTKMNGIDREIPIDITFKQYKSSLFLAFGFISQLLL